MRKTLIKILLTSIILLWLWNINGANAGEFTCSLINTEINNYSDYKSKIDNLFTKLSKKDEATKNKYYKKISSVTNKYLQKLDKIKQKKLYTIVWYLKCENHNFKNKSIEDNSILEYSDENSGISFLYDKSWWKVNIKSYNSFNSDRLEYDKKIKVYSMFFEKIWITVIMKNNKFGSEMWGNNKIFEQEKKNFKNIWWKSSGNYYYWKWVENSGLQKLNNDIFTSNMWGSSIWDASAYNIKKIYYKDLKNEKYPFIKIDWNIYSRNPKHIEFLNKKTSTLLDNTKPEQSTKLINYIVEEVDNFNKNNIKYLSSNYYKELKKVNKFVESIKVKK